jgi:hypothetical protein
MIPRSWADLDHQWRFTSSFFKAGVAIQALAGMAFWAGLIVGVLAFARWALAL